MKFEILINQKTIDAFKILQAEAEKALQKKYGEFTAEIDKNVAEICKAIAPYKCKIDVPEFNQYNRINTISLDFEESNGFRLSYHMDTNVAKFGMKGKCWENDIDDTWHFESFQLAADISNKISIKALKEFYLQPLVVHKENYYTLHTLVYNSFGSLIKQFETLYGLFGENPLKDIPKVMRKEVDAKNIPNGLAASWNGKNKCINWYKSFIEDFVPDRLLEINKLIAENNKVELKKPKRYFADDVDAMGNNYSDADPGL